MIERIRFNTPEEHKLPRSNLVSETINVLASIQPVHCFNIFSAQHRKEVEIRKNRPTIDAPFRTLVYCTKATKKTAHHLYVTETIAREDYGYLAWWHKLDAKLTINEHLPAYRYTDYLAEGFVIGEFTCDEVREFQVFEDNSIQYWNHAGLNKSCLAYDQLARYIGAGQTGYAWHIVDPVLFDKPKPLSDFGLVRAPQSWQYVQAPESDGA